MVNKTLSIWNELRPFSVGFDELFDHFNNTLEYTVKQQTSYPPYNINKIDDKYNYAILFSHNPGISQTVYSLTDHNVELKTACIALIEVNSNSWNYFKPGKCHLVTQFSPKDNLN